jgi:membrane-associated phospholipid phosphatase
VTPLIVAPGALAFRRWRAAVPLKLAVEKAPKQLVQRERPGPPCRTRFCAACPKADCASSPGTPSSPSRSPGCWRWVLPCRWAIVASVLAVLNAVTRVYLGAHNPLDYYRSPSADGIASS